MTGYKGNDIYCDLIIPGILGVEVIAETDDILAFHHTQPYWSTHIVVVPKAHVASLLDLDDDLAIKILAVIRSIARLIKDEQGACRVLTNIGDYQDSKHLHFHVSSGKQLRHD